MEAYDRSLQNTTRSGGFNISIIRRICAAIAVLSLVFLPFAGSRVESLSGLDLMQEIAKNGTNGWSDDASSAFSFLMLAVGCGIALIFLRRFLLFIIFSGMGILFSLVSYNSMSKIATSTNFAPKFGFYLSLIAFLSIIVISIIQKIKSRKIIGNDQSKSAN